VAELAASSVDTGMGCTHVRGTKSLAELAGNVCLFHELTLTVGKGAGIAVLACLRLKPKLAELSFLFCLKIWSLVFFEKGVDLRKVNSWSEDWLSNLMGRNELSERERWLRSEEAFSFLFS